MRFTAGEKAVFALVITLCATAVFATTRAGQVLFAPGSAVILTGATPAAPGATAVGGVQVDTVSTLTNGYLLGVANNGTSKLAVDFNGKLIQPCASVKAAGAATCGTAALDSSGTVTIATTAVTANSLIDVQMITAGGTVGGLYRAAPADITAATSFIIRSFVASTAGGVTAATSDTSTVYWTLIN